MKKYYVFCTYESDMGKWCVQFGGYDKSDVQFERDSWIGQSQHDGKPYKLNFLKVLTLPCGDTATMELHMAKLNQGVTA